jgi:hypothetical protein
MLPLFTARNKPRFQLSSISTRRPQKPTGATAALAQISALLGATSGASVEFAGAPPHALATRLASR